MIAYLIGNVKDKYEDFVILEVNGIGYEIFTPFPVNEDYIKLYIFEHIKEDSHDLYGFLTFKDKEIFKKLITVNGVGPKLACQMIKTYGIDELVNYIVLEDTKALGKITGIGPKTSKRIVLELKDILLKDYSPNITSSTYTDDDAVFALIALGYSEVDSQNAVNAVLAPDDTTEDIIKKSLKILSQKV
ncbi:Holliday junction DNA helicase RuvA [Candidatus Epulonipiscium fishelsonii]|uniref:Holliday junction DNA helicase RuvA n=1 Tax=Candidatus Epulonipiscium fishelsonii TaxID=77094 RepID=A0ACC8XFA6_9FIRM|nr:Holliday junction DNA helicase RuvA [Epulopiscium sp. SCG-B11WGA-EpuloA1]ONI43269.1 Holliday junction DNA helicase RuvA [Epulopiscium sp. SCG-B05WGA-EpuloA1]